MADILNTALSGDADFASTIFGSAPAPESEPTAKDTAADKPVESTDIETTQDNEVAKAEAPKPEPRAEKKTKATKEEASKAVEQVTKKASTEKSTEKIESSYEDLNEDLPVNPHFQDKAVADRPEGDDSEKGIQSWKEIKSEMKKAREERDTLRAELEATKQKVGKYEGLEIKGLQEEVETYKTQIAELQRELKAADFRRHPEYIKRVEEPVRGIQGDLRAIAEANDADLSKLWQAITEPDVRKRTDSLEDLTGDFKRMEQLAIVKMADKYHEIASIHADMERDSQGYAERSAAQKAQAEQEFIENDRRLQKAFTAKTWTSLEDRYSFLKEVEGQDEWNSRLYNAKRGASEVDLDRLSVEDRSSILARAAVVPFLESAIVHYSNQLEKITSDKNTKIKELQAQLDSLVGATPSLGKAAEIDSSDEDEDVDGYTNFGKTLLGIR